MSRYRSSSPPSRHRCVPARQEPVLAARRWPRSRGRRMSQRSPSPRTPAPGSTPTAPAAARRCHRPRGRPRGRTPASMPTITPDHLDVVAPLGLVDGDGRFVVGVRSRGRLCVLCVRVVSSRQPVSSNSPGRQVWSNHGSSGPYSRSTMNQPFPGTVWIQFSSRPAGAVGPK
jgi:hypothetical protein